MRNKIGQFFSFTFFSGLGLLIDFIVFNILCYLGVQPFISNLISSCLGLATVFIFVGRYTFSANNSWGKFPIFLAWYFLIIYLSSIGISVLGSTLGMQNWVSKILVSGISLPLNFVFNRVLFGKKFSFKGLISTLKNLPKSNG